MDLRKKDLQKDSEILMTGQVVDSQSEIVTSKTYYSGTLIKAKRINTTEADSDSDPAYKKQPFLTGIIMFIILLAIVPVAIYEFSKSWIQDYINQFRKIPTESFSS